ncbi:MAG: hypothetical protein MW690_001661 [Methanophagales archaeon]|nr:DUF3344 domain-containing protein [Methanophagales archaeon]MCU4140185.1 hypothetical protein [Methanophagales archaeon]
MREAIRSQEGLEAVAYREEEAGLSGMLLLIIYKDSSAPLMEYWINEGVDVIWANEEKDTKPEQCIVRAPFDTSLDKNKVGEQNYLLFYHRYLRILNMHCSSIMKKWQ